MKPTPRTDALWKAWADERTPDGKFRYGPHDLADFARQLERENQTFRAAQKACEDCDAPRVDRIAELESELATWESELSKVMPPDFKDWWQNSKSEWPLVARLVIESKTEWCEMIDAEVGTLREELAAERALGDRLADSVTDLRQLLKAHGQGCGTGREALSAWKESRSGTV